MNALTFQIHLHEPVLVTQVGSGDSNSAVGFDFIPGSVIRGALIGRYLQRRNEDKVDAIDKDFRRLFFDGNVRFLNAYPSQTRTEVRTLPTPLSWRRGKDEDHPIYNIALDNSGIEIEKEKDSSKNWVLVNEPFCSMRKEVDEKGDHQTELYKPATQIKIHTARSDRQNVTKDGSTIFRYLALDSDQNFAGVILADDKSDLDEIEALLGGNTTLSIGKSHLAGYGHVKVGTVKTEDGWKEYTTASKSEENCIVITLLSDAIVRDDKTGEYVATIEPIMGKHEKAFVRTRVQGGFNHTWNLPLPQTLAIQAGSVFVYKNKTGLLDKLKNLETTGIGERRVEGFGRIAVDRDQECKICIVNSDPPTTHPVKLTGDTTLAQRTVNRMMRAKLDEALIKKVNEMSIKDITGRIHNTQLSRMRVVARRAWSENDADMILQHIKGMKSPARSQFEHAVIERKSLYEWLKERAGKPNSIRDILGISSDKPPSIGGIEPDLTGEMELEYTVRLIDGVLRKALKEGKK